jgi:hypothetical protein
VSIKKPILSLKVKKGNAVHRHPDKKVYATITVVTCNCSQPNPVPLFVGKAVGNYHLMDLPAVL